ncbi:Aspartyl protease [Flexibacter flexilis DSM 6793]|uniref:Aspartyl protease n=1 Tax=Flexibacter flexilis DSM 6793 TaxID=927664 RepID=A0A1I1FUW2_9BACT|nr:retropepsin-like aspartic protease [Flexibacter flexilis]SFC00853.1 Aspartyl protease [Flexibacter flexilis DSM 6793]
MKLIIRTFLLIILTSQLVNAQKTLPTLKTNKTSISIQEGNSEYKDVWEISPEVKLDVFVANPFRGTQTIVFRSDIDSISFTVKPNKKYDFIILLNGKDKAYTQISTYSKAKPSLEPKLFYTRLKKANTQTDTIPFTLGKDNWIHLKGKINNSDTVDFLFDTGAGICVITSSIINKKVNLTIDGSEENGGTDGIATVDKSAKNVIEISNLKWENVPLLSINYQKPTFDAVMGWVAFENKIIEIDYEKHILVVHQFLPNLSAEYTKLPYQLIGGVPYIKCKLVVNKKEVEGWFDFDSGSNGELIIGQKFARDNALNDAMKNIGTSISVGSTGKAIKNNKVILPKLKLGDYEMYQVPLAIQEQEVEGDEHNENIGNNILKRFNTIIDFKAGFIYLKPNNLFYTPIIRN